MPRLIDADVLIEQYKTKAADEWNKKVAPMSWAAAWEEIINDIEETPTVGGWINVKDRMPEKRGQYLCWFGKNMVTKGAAIATYFEMWKAFGSLESLETYPNVTHWMPLPEPPKEENSGSEQYMP